MLTQAVDQFTASLRTARREFSGLLGDAKKLKGHALSVSEILAGEKPGGKGGSDMLGNALGTVSVPSRVGTKITATDQAVFSGMGIVDGRAAAGIAPVGVAAGAAAGGAARGGGLSFGGAIGIGMAAQTIGTGVRIVGGGMPDFAQTIGYESGYYAAALRQNVATRDIREATRTAMSGGITSPGSDAAVSRFLSSQGVVYSEDPNSTYMQMVTGTKNAAKYLGMENEAAAAAIEGMTGGQMSMNLLTQMGIYTSDPTTGKAYTQGEVFEQMAQRLTMGRGEATVESTQESIRRGNLGEFIRNSGMSADQQEMFKQYMVERAKGTPMDLSNEAAMEKLLSEREELGANPQQGLLELNTLSTEAMAEYTDAYVSAMDEAVVATRAMVDALKLVPGPLREFKAFSDLLGGTGPTQGLSQLGPILKMLIGLGAAGAVGGPSGGGTTLGAAAANASVGGSGTRSGMVSGASGSMSGSLSWGGGTGGAKESQDGSSQKSSSKGASSTSSSDRPRFTKPSNGRITSGFGPRTRSGGAVGSTDHKGVDYGSDQGLGIFAAADGTVEAAKMGTGYGNYIYISHPGGFRTVYAHLKSFSVSANDQVRRGQHIGVMGTTGNSNGVHLHFEIQKNGVPVDPLGYVGGSAPAGGKTPPQTTPSQGSEKPAGDTSRKPGEVKSSGVHATKKLGTFTEPIEIKDILGFGLVDPASEIGNTQTGAPLWSLSGTWGSMSSARATERTNETGGGGNLSAALNTGTMASQISDPSLPGVGSKSKYLPESGSITGESSRTNHVTINVQLSNSSDGEARRLAVMVKQYLEEETIFDKMGRH